MTIWCEKKEKWLQIKTSTKVKQIAWTRSVECTISEILSHKVGAHLTWGGYFRSSAWNSAAHSPHGYSLALRWKYELSASRSSAVGCFGFGFRPVSQRRWSTNLRISQSHGMPLQSLSYAISSLENKTHSSFHVARPSAALQ